MPGVPFGILRQLEAAGFDPSASLPPVNLSAQLVYILNDLSKRALPIPTVYRQAFSNNISGVVDVGGILVRALDRCVHVLRGQIGRNGADVRVGILANALVPAFNGAAGEIDDNTFPVNISDPAGGLASTSLYSAGDWTAAAAPLTVNPNGAYNLEATPATAGHAPDTFPTGMIIPPGFTLVVQGFTINVLTQMGLYWEELGP